MIGMGTVPSRGAVLDIATGRGVFVQFRAAATESVPGHGIDGRNTVFLVVERLSARMSGFFHSHGDFDASLS
jgi:hypothetical protein